MEYLILLTITLAGLGATLGLLKWGRYTYIKRLKSYDWSDVVFKEFKDQDDFINNHRKWDKRYHVQLVEGTNKVLNVVYVTNHGIGAASYNRASLRRLASQIREDL